MLNVFIYWYKSEATLSEGLKNTLNKTDYSVTKKWDDENNEYSSRQNITLELQYRIKNSNTEWADVSIVSGTDGVNAITNNPFTVGTTPSEVTIKFSDLPVSDKTGNMYEYRVVETKIGTSSVSSNQRYLFHIPKPDGEGWETSYATKFHNGINNYYVNYKQENDKTTITNKIVPNVVSYVHVMAKKTWDDENNKYGKRPQSITFTLTRTKTTVTVDQEGNITESAPADDGEFGRREKTVGEQEKWTTVWAHCAAFDDTGNRFEYKVTENAITEYDTTSDDPLLETDTNGDLIRTYNFTNKYEPALKSLKASKVWNDTNNQYSLRPQQIQFELWCKYDVYTYSDDDSLTPEKQNEGYDAPVYVDEQHKSAVYDVLDDSTKNLFNANSSKFIIMADSQGKWEKIFEKLPAYINPIGEDKTQKQDSVYQKNGQAVPVKYYIKEYIPKITASGYDYTEFVPYDSVVNYPYSAYSIPETDPAETSPTSREVSLSREKTDTTVPEVKLGNQLRTRSIIVAKSWNDNSYMAGETNQTTVLGNMHYNTKVTLSSSMFQKNSGDYAENKIIAKTDKNGVKFDNLPKYDAKGQVIEYTVREELTTQNADDSEQIANAYHTNKTPVDKGDDKPFSQGNTQYMYDGQCTRETTNDNENEAPYLTQYNILDSLPLTAVTVVKHWKDQDNKFDLRPDSISLKLEQKAVNENDLPTLDASTLSGWTDPMYSTHDTGENVFPVKSGNDWTYTYKKLLKYDVSNHPYVFRITELAQAEGYKAPQYCSAASYSDTTPVNDKQYVTAVLTKGTVGVNEVWDDGIHSLAEQFEITNKLNTRNIIVTKAWNDNEYDSAKASNLHYDLKITLSGLLNNNPATPLQYNSEDFKSIKILGKNAKDSSDNRLNLIFKDLPIYGKDGNVIAYKVKEEKAEGTYTLASGEDVTTAVVIVGGKNVKAVDTANFTQDTKSTLLFIGIFCYLHTIYTQ